MDKLIGVAGAKVRIVHMRLGDSVVELFDYYHPKGRDPLPDPQQSDFGLIHIGFRVTNFHETYRELRKRGVQFLGEPIEIKLESRRAEGSTLGRLSPSGSRETGSGP